MHTGRITLAAMAALLFVIGLRVSCLPDRRAARVDPSVALSQE